MSEEFIAKAVVIIVVLVLGLLGLAKIIDECDK